MKPECECFKNGRGEQVEESVALAVGEAAQAIIDASGLCADSYEHVLVTICAVLCLSVSEMRIDGPADLERIDAVSTLMARTVAQDVGERVRELQEKIKTLKASEDMGQPSTEARS